MKKVALVLYSDTDFGGAERRLIRIYNELAKKNLCDLLVRGCKSVTLFNERLKKADCDVSNINEIKCFDSNMKCLAYIVLRGKYEVLQYIDLCGFNQILAKIYQIMSQKTIFTVAYQNYAYGLIDDKTKKKLVKLLNTSQKVDVLFPAGKEYFEKISSNGSITTTPGTFTNLDLFVPDHKKKIILFAAARLEKDKNAELLVEACNISQNKLRQYGYKVMICGQGFEEEFLRKLVNKYHISDIVNMPGYVKISDVIPKAEVFVCIDLVDNYPSQTIAEAVACGCSLICTDVGYSRKCGDENFTVFVENDSEDLSEAINAIIKKSDKEKQKIVQAARSYAVSNYNIETSVDYFEKLMM